MSHIGMAWGQSAQTLMRAAYLYGLYNVAQSNKLVLPLMSLGQVIEMAITANSKTHSSIQHQTHRTELAKLQIKFTKNDKQTITEEKIKIIETLI